MAKLVGIGQQLNRAPATPIRFFAAEPADCGVYDTDAEVHARVECYDKYLMRSVGQQTAWWALLGGIGVGALGAVWMTRR